MPHICAGWITPGGGTATGCQRGQALSKLPSAYFPASTTFQHDRVAFRSIDMLYWHRLMWANAFPHGDSTSPWSQPMLAERAAHLTAAQRRAILCDSVAGLYRIDLSAMARQTRIGGPSRAGW